MTDAANEISKIATSDQDAALKTVMLAFSGDPAARTMYPDAVGYLAGFPGFAERFGGKAFELGTAYGTACGGGVALWLPPGEHVDQDPIERHMMATVDPERLEEMGAGMADMAAYHPEEPHWYLAVLGVDPGKQGKGLGGALLAHTLAQADAEGMPAYLESSNPRNVSLYLRYGFEPLGTIDIGGQPIMTPMLRPARG